MKNKYLLIPGENTLEKVCESNFLFPLKSFATNLGKTFSFAEIPESSYIYINRLLHAKDILLLKEELSQNKNKIKGIVFEDLGVLEVIKELDLKVEKILYLTHATCSSYTVNTFLEYVDTLILANDITKEEVLSVLAKSSKPIGLYLYGHLPYMYSRRTLLTNFSKHFHMSEPKIRLVKEKVSGKEFLVSEDEFGTIFYDALPYDGRDFLDEKVSYFLIDLHLEKVESMATWLKDFVNKKPIPNTTRAFLDKKVIVRLPPKGGVR